MVIIICMYLFISPIKYLDLDLDPASPFLVREPDLDLDLDFLSRDLDLDFLSLDLDLDFLSRDLDLLDLLDFLRSRDLDLDLQRMEIVI